MLPSPSLSLPSPSLSFPALPCREAALWKPARESDRALLGPQWGPGQSPSHSRIFLCFELDYRTWQQHFWLFILAWNDAFTHALRKKTRLYQQEVPVLKK